MQRFAIKFCSTKKLKSFGFLLPTANDNLLLESVERIFSSLKETSLEDGLG